VKYILIRCCVAGAILLYSTLSFAEESQPQVTEEAKDQPGQDFFQQYIHDHLEIGTRSTGYTFKTDTKGAPFNGSYLGSLNEIHEHQNYAPVKAYVQYKFSPYGGLGIAYDQFKVATGMSPSGEESGDGTFELQGAYIYLLGAFENESRFTPYAELGVAFYSVDFNAKEWWTEGGRRVFNPENATGIALAIGCDVQVYKQWSVDLYLRYMDVDVDVDYVFDRKYHTVGTFEVSHYDYGIGVKYSF